MPQAKPCYRGRFAPSPSGPLHLGSLIAAVASYLDAKHHGGSWLLRIEDLDPPREQAGASESILRSLEAHGLLWDEAPVYQSHRHPAYLEALEALQSQGHLFHCDCSRALIGANGCCAQDCVNRQQDLNTPTACRIHVDKPAHFAITDAYQGQQHWALGEQLSDFTLRRKDGLFAYQLAVVIDDAWQGISHIHRGSDLLDSTPRQLFLQQLLGLPQPRYGHFPVITHRQQKLSKQNHAPALQDENAAENLRAALRFLGQAIPDEASAERLLAQAVAQWQPKAVPQAMAVAAGALLYPHRGLA